MPKVTVYLPDDLHALMKALEISPSEVLQDAIRNEAWLVEKRRALDAYLEELRAEVGAPTAEDLAWARRVVV